MNNIDLNSILNPSYIKDFSTKELENLSQNIRERIIEVMACNGGHLASGLGAVELTIALHKVFNTPQDKLIWDVGHQTYPHKILTGRNKAFSQVRKYKGPCGFTHPKESPYDHFHAGHAGPALSQALGVAKTRELLGNDEYIIPIIGDATLTCGLAHEALNNVSKDLKKFIIILNDNAMSISKNVGAITHILGQVINNPTTKHLYHELERLLEKIPNLGQTIKKQTRKIAESVKTFISPASFFEQYGLSYHGPVDGHDLAALIEMFERVKNSDLPVIIHINTIKGYGLDIAEKNPIKWHGAKPFNIDTCKFSTSSNTKPTFPKIFGKHLLKMGKEDPNLLCVTPAMSAGSCLDDFMKEFPDRCFDVGIAESHSVTFAGGLGYEKKKKVFVSIYSTFLQRALDNIFHDVCLQEIPIVFAIDRSGLAGGDGATHNGIYDISFLNAMPNMIIAQPRNGQLLKELMESSFSWQQPAAIRYPNCQTTEDTSSRASSLVTHNPGKGEVLIQGSRIAILALGNMEEIAIKVHELLKEQEGIEVTVVDPIFIKPLDSELLCELLLTHQSIVTIEEHSLNSGFGSIINNFLMSHGYLNTKVLNFGIPEAFIEHGSRPQLLESIDLTPEKIVKKIQSQLLAPSSSKTLTFK